MRLFLATLLLSGCRVGHAAYVCDYTYTMEDQVLTGEYGSVVISCGDYAQAGWQIVSSDNIWDDCESDGYAQGALESTCSCSWDLGPLCNPRRVND